MYLAHWRHFWLARLFEIARCKERALEEYRRALRFNPRFAKALNKIGFLLASENRFAAAEENFAEAVRVEPDDAYAHFNLGFVREKLRKREAAIEAFREAVRLRPTLDRGWYGLGMAHAALGEHPDAARAFDEAARLQPMNPHAWYALGMAHHHCHNPDKVKEVIEYLFRFDPVMSRRLIHDAGRSDLAHLVKDLMV